MLGSLIICALVVASEADRKTEWIGNMASWNGFFVDFVTRKDFPILVFAVDEQDDGWTRWNREILLRVVKRTNVAFSTLFLDKKTQNNATERDFYYDINSLKPLFNLEYSFYLVTSFRSKRDAIFVSKVFADENLMKASVILIADDVMNNLVTEVYFPHSNQALLAKYAGNEAIDIWETFQLDKFSPAEFQKVGHWSPSHEPGGGNLTLDEEDNVVRRNNLHGRVLKCVSTMFAPYTIVEEGKDGQKEFIGWMFDMIDIVKKYCNFTYECAEPPDGEWGAFRKNRWTGMVGETVRGNADIVIAPLDHTPARAAVVDFTFAVAEIGYHLVIRRPSQADVTWSSYVMELSADSWLVIVVYFLVAWLSLSLIPRLSPKELVTFSCQDAFLIIIGSLSSNANGRSLSSLSSRILVFTLYMTSFLVLAHYTAFLTSSLAITTLTLPFTTIQEMLLHKDYGFGFPVGLSVEDTLKQTSNPIYQQVYDHFVRDKEDSLPKTFPEGIHKVKEEKFALLMGYLNFKASYGDDCQLIILKQGYFDVPSAYAVQKNSPLLRILNYYMHKIRETGLVNKLWKKWQPANFDCSLRTKTSLGLWNVMTAFMIVGFALVVSLALLTKERLGNKMRSPQMD